MNKRQFIHDMRKAGASQDEVDGLFRIAQGLSEVTLPKPSAQKRERIALKTDLPFELTVEKKRLRYPIIWSTAGAFTVILAVLVLAQFASPASPLYGIRRSIDDVRAAIWPTESSQTTKNHDNTIHQLPKQPTPAPDVVQDIEQDYQKPDTNSAQTENNSTNNSINQHTQPTDNQYSHSDTSEPPVNTLQRIIDSFRRFQLLN